MRISDWSSDVCSSDLLGGCVHDQFLSIRRGRLRPASKPPWGERVLKAGLVVGSAGQAAAVLRHRVAASSAVSWPCLSVQKRWYPASAARDVVSTAWIHSPRHSVAEPASANGTPGAD